MNLLLRLTGGWLVFLFLNLVPTPLLAATCSPPPTGLVGWWRAEGNVIDTSGHGPDGDSPPPSYGAGHVGQAFLFSGTNPGIEIGNASAWQNQDFTIEAWIQRADPTDVSAGGRSHGILLAGAPGGYGLALATNGQLVMFTPGASGAEFATAVGSSNVITDLAWHHVAAAKNGSEVHFYIDGSPAGTSAFESSFTFTGPFSIGAFSSNASASFTFWGSIDEISLYDRGLLAGEVASIHASGTAGKCLLLANNLILSAGPPLTVSPGSAFDVTFRIHNQGNNPVGAVIVSIELPTGFVLTTNTTTRGASTLATGIHTTVIGPLPGDTNAVITLTGYSTGSGDITFNGSVSMDGLDTTQFDNQVIQNVHVAGKCLPLPSGLIAWLRADGTTHEEFSHATTSIGTIRYAPGRVGLAYDLDGASDIAIQNDPAFESASFTVEAWVYPTKLDGEVDIIVNKDAQFPNRGTDIQFELGIKGIVDGALGFIPQGNLAFYLGGVGGLPNNYGGWIDAKAAITLNQWSHVALVVTPDSAATYLNGTPTAKFTGLTGALSTNVWPIRIGGRAPAYHDTVRSTDRFNGRIDEFGYYQRALDPAEIASLFEAGENGKCATPVENLAVRSSAPVSTRVGGDFPIRFTVSNQGAQPATGVTLATPLPSGFILVSSSTTQGVISGSGAETTTPIGTLAGGASAQVTFIGHANTAGRLDFQGLIHREGVDVYLDDNVVTNQIGILDSCLAAPAGLVAFLPGEGDASDTLGHLTQATGLEYVPGKVGQAFLFTGTNAVTLPDAPEFNGNSFTIETWIYPTLLDGWENVIVSKEAFGRLPQFILGIKGTRPSSAGIPVGHIAFYIDGAFGFTSGDGGWVDGLGITPLNTWSHVALTVGPEAVTVYLNGQITRRITSLNGPMIPRNAPIRIGERDPSFGIQERFKGLMDEFSFYGRALTDAQIAAIYTAGEFGKCIVAVAPTIVTAPVNQSVPAGTPVTFAVGAGGSRPLRYQWMRNGTNIVAATNATLQLSNPRRGDQGTYSVTVCNDTGCAPTVGATLTVTPIPAVLQVINATAKSPYEVVVPIRLIGNANENALSFSVNFDSQQLTYRDAGLGADTMGGQILINESLTKQGQLGVILALPAGASLNEDTNEVIRLTFTTAAVTTDRVAWIDFTDRPIVRKLSDPFGKALPSFWLGGQVFISAVDYEADVNPVPNGDKQVDISDWVQVGRYVAGLDELAPGVLFQHADSAPLSTGGNGLLTVSDWVQAGRFAVGLDPLVPAAGPLGPVPVPASVSGRGLARVQAPAGRTIAIANEEILAGQTKEIPVMLTASGDENAVAFSLNFDPATVTFIGATAGAGAKNANLNINAKQAASGRIGFALALTSGAKFGAGNLELVRLKFSAANHALGSSNLSFVDSPVVREVANSLAETLPGNWTDARVSVIPPTITITSPATPGDGAVVVSWPAGFTAAVLESTGDLPGTQWAPVPGTPVLKAGAHTMTLPVTNTASYFRIRLP